MIRTAEVSKMAHQLGLGDKTIEKDYVLTWILNAISASPLNEILVFKGGTALKKIYIPDYRFSEDLDFTLLAPQYTNSELLAMIESLFPWLAQNVNLNLAVKNVEKHKTGNLTIYIYFSGPLQAQLTNRSLKIDISRDEVLVFPINNKPILSPYSDCLGSKSVLKVYALEEILAEKLRSLLSRSEPRDLFDIHYLLTNRMVDIEQMVFSIESKFDAKGLTLSDLRTVLTRKRAVFKRYWQKRLTGQMPEIPELRKVIREMNRFLAKYF